MANIITTDTKAARFDPSEPYMNRMTFVLISNDPAQIKKGIEKLKATMEQGLVDFIPAHYRKHVRRTMAVNAPPKESWIRWDYDPPKKGK